MKPLEIELNCPECGGDLVWLEHQRLKRCSYCGSMLYFEQNEENRFHIEPTVKTSQQIKAVLVLSKAEKKRAEQAASYSNGNPDQPNIIDVGFLPLTPYLEEFDRKISLLQTRLIYVPYWHFQAISYHSLLATLQNSKEYSLRRTIVDEAIPAYDDSVWNFRDRGLRFGETRLKPVTKDLFSAIPHLPFTIFADSQLERSARSYKPPDEEKSYLFKFHQLCGQKRLPVFRPYWFVLFRCTGEEAVLVDACYETVAGYPDRQESLRFLSYQKTPYSSENPPEVRVISSRCPVCGVDVDWEALEVTHFCRNCGRALVLNSGQIESVLYKYDPGKGSSCIHIPFWKFPVQLIYQNKTYNSLRNYFRLFFPERLLKLSMNSNSLWIPGIRIKRAERGDQLLSALIAQACAFSGSLLEGPISTPGEIRNSELDPSHASEMLGCVLPAASGIPPGLHKLGSLNAMHKNTTIDFQRASLNLLSFPVQGSNLVVGKQYFSIQLLES